MHLHERRQFKRYPTRLKVFDEETGKLLGYIEDINFQGMKTKSKERLPDVQDIKIWFEVGSHHDGTDKIHLTVSKQWDAFTDSTPRHYHSGLKIVRPSEHVQELLQDMIFKLSGEMVEQS